NEAEPDANVWTPGYRLRSTSWQGGAMPMITRATNVLATLDAELSGGRPIIFVCHSYGGLLLEQMLRPARDIPAEYQRLADRVTPSFSLERRTTVRQLLQSLQPSRHLALRSLLKSFKETLCICWTSTVGFGGEPRTTSGSFDRTLRQCQR